MRWDVKDPGLYCYKKGRMEVNEIDYLRELFPTLMSEPCVQQQKVTSHTSLTTSCTVNSAKLQYILIIIVP